MCPPPAPALPHCQPPLSCNLGGGGTQSEGGRPQNPPPKTPRRVRDTAGGGGGTHGGVQGWSGGGFQFPPPITYWWPRSAWSCSAGRWGGAGGRWGGEGGPRPERTGWGSLGGGERRRCPPLQIPPLWFLLPPLGPHHPPRCQAPLPWSPPRCWRARGGPWGRRRGGRRRMRPWGGARGGGGRGGALWSRSWLETVEIKGGGGIK